MSVPSWLPVALLTALVPLTLAVIGGALLDRPKAARRYPWWLRLVALGFGPGLTLFFCVMGMVEPPNDRDAPIFYWLIAGFGIVGFPLCWELMRFGYALVPGGIDAVSPWRGRWFIRWEDVDAVSYFAGWFRIESRGSRFAIPLVVPDGKKLLEEAEKHLDQECLTGAIAGYTAVGRRFPYTGNPPRSLRK